MVDIWLIRSTFAKKDEALSVARTLLEEKLIACANITESMLSVYRWEGLIQQEEEVLLLVKTTQRRVAPAMARLKALHPYQIPGILAWAATEADERFSDWVDSETA